MKNIYKILLSFGLLFFFYQSSLAQLNTNIMFVNNEYQIINLDSKFFLGSHTTFHNGILHVSWKICNDNNDGIYIVFKSQNFKDFTPVDFINYEIQPHHQDKIISMTIIDNKYSNEFNFYHIIKIDDNSPNLNYEMFRFEALNNIYFSSEFGIFKENVALKVE